MDLVKKLKEIRKYIEDDSIAFAEDVLKLCNQLYAVRDSDGNLRGAVLYGCENGEVFYNIDLLHNVIVGWQGGGKGHFILQG